MARRRWLAAVIGIVAGALAFGGYIGATYAGIRLNPQLIEVAGAALAFAAAVAVFSLVIMDKPSPGTAKARLMLNDKPATGFIFPLEGDGVAAMQATPEMSLPEILARYQDVMKPLADGAKKPIVLTLKASARGKPFATLTLQQLFLALKPLGLMHVLLVNSKNGFIGYIPGPRALTEFAGDKTDVKIGTYIVKVLENPESSTVLREIDGIASDDTVAQTDDSRHAEAKIWANESIRGLVVHRHLKPVGYISKVDLLTLNTRWT